VTRGKKATSSKQAGKLKVRKETIRDLDVKRKGKDVKGGQTTRTLINQLTCFMCVTK
jgi:hypothetical protein